MGLAHCVGSVRCHALAHSRSKGCTTLSHVRTETTAGSTHRRARGVYVYVWFCESRRDLRGRCLASTPRAASVCLQFLFVNLLLPRPYLAVSGISYTTNELCAMRDPSSLYQECWTKETILLRTLGALVCDNKRLNVDLFADRRVEERQAAWRHWCAFGDVSDWSVQWIIVITARMCRVIAVK